MRNCLYPIINPETFNYYKKAQSALWVSEEIDLSKDIDDWNKLNDDEKEFITSILAFFASSDLIVADNLSLRFMNEPMLSMDLEAKLFYGLQYYIEGVHSETYSLLIDTYIKDKEKKNNVFNALQYNPIIKKKAEYCIKYIESNLDYVYRLVAFAVVEGIFFSSSFCAIYWFKKRGLMSGLTFSNELISRDESLHTLFAIHLFKIYSKGQYKNSKLIPNIIKEGVELEKEFVKDCLKVDLIGMNAKEMCKYVEYCADRLLLQLGYDKIYNSDNPFHFMEMISLSNKGNFFETKISQYSMASVSNALEGSSGFSITDDF
jgi:ribonucleoside-diphosphate reductase beta chain